MMNKLSTEELTRIRTAQTEAMQDTCVLQTYSETFNSFGEPIKTWTAGSSVACGVEMKPGGEKFGSDNVVIEYEATIRLPITTSVNIRDRINITSMFGETVNYTYDIAGPIQRNSSRIKLLLKKTEN